MSTKIIGLDSLKHIKSYIDKVRGSIREELDADTKAYLEEGIKEASEAIYKDYDSKYKELTDAIARAEANGGEGLEALKLQLDALVNNTNDKFDALDSLETEVGKLSGDYDDLYDGITTGKIFSAGQLNEIINTAMINNTTITDDGIWTPNVFTGKIVSLIGNFGSVKAANIAAGTIAGSSIESTNTIVTAPNPNKVEAGEPVWKIDNAGNGWFARGNIHWDADGNVTFGPGVSLKWESISNADRIMQDIFEGYDSEVREYVQNFVKDSTQGAASKEELERLKNEADKAVEDLKIDIDNNKQAADEAFEAIEKWKTEDYNSDQQKLKDYADGVAIALEEAYKTGDEALIAQLEALKKEIEWEMEKQYEEFKKETEALSDLRNDFKDLQNSALTKYNMEDLLAASLVDKTEWNDYQISTPSLLAKKIVGLTATFGHINASRIVGTNIQGYTISSPTGMKDATGEIIYTETFEKEIGPDGKPVQATDEFGTKLWEKDPETGEPLVDENGNYIPVWQYASEIGPNGEPIPIRVPAELPKEDVAWQLNADGSGHVAERQISWDYPRKDNGEIDYPIDKTTDEQKRYWRRDNVKVELGEGVQITWVTDALNKIGSKLADWAADGKMSPIEQKELLDLYNEYTEEYTRLCAQYDNYVALTCPFPENLKSDFDGAYNNLTSTVKHHTRGIYDWNSNTPLKDIVNEDGSITEVILTIDINKEDDGSAVANTKKIENVKNFAAVRETFADGVAKAYSDWKSEKTTKEHLGNWAKDGVLSPIEQKSLREEYLQSREEKIKLLDLCKNLEDEKKVQVSFEDTFTAAFSKFEAACKYHTSGIWDWTNDIALEGDAIKTIAVEKSDENNKYINITNYYAVKSQFINALNTTLTETVSTEFEIGLKQAFNDWAKDGVLSPIEQKELKAVYDNISAEYVKLCEQYTNYVTAGAIISSTDKKTFDDAFTAFKNAVKKYTAGILTWSGDNYTPKVDDNITTVDVESDYSNIKAYYTTKQSFITIMNRALGAANVSEADANRKAAMNAWANGGVLSPIEQKDLKKTYEELIKEKAQISADIKTITDAGLIVDNVDAFNTAYSNMVKAVKKHTEGVYTWTSDTAATAKPEDEMTNVTIVTSGDTRYDLIPAYYEAKQKVLTSLSNAIADKARAAAESAAASYTDTAKGIIDQNLVDAEKRLNEAIAAADDEAIAAAEGARELAQDAHDALDTLKTALYGNWDDDPGDGSVLNSGDLYNLSLAACGAAAAKALDSGSIAADNVFAQNIVGLAGTFAEITAEQITSTEIEGKTLSSTDKASGKDYKKWQLNADGSGWVANKQIEWNADGSTVTLGSNVKIAWGNVTGSDAVNQSISNAQSTANSANTAASNAQTAADNANTAASNAQSTANSANTAASNAQTAADNANTAASNAQNAASNAQSTANDAKNIANSKVNSEQVGQAITTSLSAFEIASHKIKGNLISGKTFESSTNVTLEEGTIYYTHGNPDTNGNYTITSNTAGTNSSGPAWQIVNDGTGYLAGGAIRFNKDGITGVNGDQLMDGGLGTSEKLSQLIAEKAQIGNIEVGVLNTGYGKDTDNGRIKIEDNTISVYKEGAQNEIMQISGSTSIGMTSMINVNHNFGMTSPVTNGNVSGVVCVEIARNFLISDQFNYTLNDVSVTLNNFTVTTNSASLYFGIIFSKTELNANSNISWASMSGITTGSNTRSLQCYINRNGTLSQINPASLPNDTYYVYAASHLIGGNISSSTELGANVNNIKISIGPNLNKTIISSKGLFCGMGKFKYLSMTENGFEVSFGTNDGQGLRVSTDGIQKRVVSTNSSWTNL